MDILVWLSLTLLPLGSSVQGYRPQESLFLGIYRVRAPSKGGEARLPCLPSETLPNPDPMLLASKT